MEPITAALAATFPQVQTHVQALEARPDSQAKQASLAEELAEVDADRDAELLPRLIGSRQRGPLFLADRPRVPSRAPASEDLCPETGRARLSYRRAAELFVAATRDRTHGLRRAALTHLGEDNVSLPLLMAKSRHKNLRSLQRYVRPSREAVAALTAQHDPARRRRRAAEPACVGPTQMVMPIPQDARHALSRR